LIPSPIKPLYIILTITLTVILISSPVMTVLFSTSSFLTPIILKVGFASATSSGDGGDDESDTDAATTTTDDGEENGDGDDEQQEEDNSEQQQDVQGEEEGNTEEEQDAGEGGQGEQQQFATVIGEVCDDLEDNDGDGLIDLADVEDCAPPATQGTITAPTTTTPSPSVINTTATNSTNNTLTASGITAADLGPPWDLAKQCIPIEQLGIPRPVPAPDDPPNIRWYSCPDGLLWSDPPVTSNSGIGQFGGGGQQPGGQQQQQPNSASGIDPATGQPISGGQTSGVDPATGQPIPPPTLQAPSSTASQGGQQGQPPPTTSQGVEQGPVTTDNPDGSKTTRYPAGMERTTYLDGRSVIRYDDGRVEVRNADGSGTSTMPGSGIEVIFGPYYGSSEASKTVTLKYPGGIEITDDIFGKRTIKYPGGQTILFRDGSMINIPEDAAMTVIRPPGVDKIEDFYGNPVQYTKADWHIYCWFGWLC
jgi:hypothetical protein